MNKNILAVVLLFFSAASAQKIQYYDYDWKECGAEKASFKMESYKDDSGWHYRSSYLPSLKPASETHFITIAGTHEYGWVVSYYANGRISEHLLIYNKRLEGPDLRYYYNGMLKDSVVFHNGNETGIALGWYASGAIRDSVNYAGDGKSVQVNWYENGQLASAGHWNNYLRNGRWLYYHPNGINAAIEDYQNGTLLHALYYDEDGVQLTDTSHTQRNAAFPGGHEKWLKLIKENLQFPPGVKLENTREIAVVVSFRVDEEGHVKDAWVEIPFQPLFDAEALRVVALSPRWIPAISHNQRISSDQRQVIYFRQE